MCNLETKILSAPLGKTYIISIGQAGFIIKNSSGELLGIDLYLSDCVERYEGHKGFKRLLPHLFSPSSLQFDCLICTHPHLDHFDVDSVPEMIANGKTKLFCSSDCEKYININNLHHYDRNITYVTPGSKFTVGNFSLKFVNCDHGIAAPDAVGIVIEVDRFLIYFTGDTCLRLDRLEEIPRNVDILIAPINGAFGNLDEEDCSKLAQAIQPKFTIPCHYGMFASHHGDVGKFFEIMQELNLPTYIMYQGEILVIER